LLEDGLWVRYFPNWFSEYAVNCFVAVERVHVLATNEKRNMPATEWAGNIPMPAVLEHEAWVIDPDYLPTAEATDSEDELGHGTPASSAVGSSSQPEGAPQEPVHQPKALVFDSPSVCKAAVSEETAVSRGRKRSRGREGPATYNLKRCKSDMVESSLSSFALSSKRMEVQKSCSSTGDVKRGDEGPTFTPRGRTRRTRASKSQKPKSRKMTRKIQDEDEEYSPSNSESDE
jgi:hypothetical protein